MNTTPITRIKPAKDTNSVLASNKGFTLIEIMVASSIFIIVMVIAVGAVLALVDGDRRAQAVSSVVSNLNIALESMVRDIRTGTNYNISSSNCADSITFTNSDFNQTTYSRNGNFLHKNVPSTGLNGDITAPEVTISCFSITPRGIGIDQTQPLLLVQVSGVVGTGKYTSPFSVQTLISQRVLEN